MPKKANANKQNKGTALQRVASTPKKKSNSNMNPRSTRTVSAPVATFVERLPYFTIKQGSKADSVRIQGQDYLANLTWSPTSTVGAAITNILISPGSGSLVNTRLGRFAQLYDKYCFKNLKFHSQPSAATSNSGAYILCFDRDVSDPTPAANQDAIRQYLAHAGSRMGAAWEAITIDCPLSDTQSFYYTSPSGQSDERLIYQGQLYVAVGTQIATTQTLNLWVEYDIELYDPQLELALVEAKQTNSSNFTTSNVANAAWDNLTTPVVATAAVPFIQNSAGHRGFVVSPGTWYLEQLVTQSSVGGQVIAASAAFDAVTGLDITSTVVSALDTAFVTAPAIAGAVASRIERLFVPGPNNAIVYGNWSSGGQTATTAVVRLLEMFGLLVV